MWARVTRFEDVPEKLDGVVRQFKNELGPAIAKQGGTKGSYLFVDRKSGRGMAITLWDSERSLQASEDSAKALRSDATQQQKAAGLTVWGVERYEVAVVGQPAVRAVD